MELYVELLAAMLSRAECQVTFPQLAETAEELVESASYRTLQKIKAVVEDDRLDDVTCFLRIEEIIRILEVAGTTGGSRHDFG